MPTNAITNKGFIGFPSASLASNFMSDDTNAAPISLTGHSLNVIGQHKRRHKNKN